MRTSSIDDELIEKFRKECLQSFFPSAHIASVMAFGSAHTKKFGHANIFLGDGFSNLQNTMYQFRGTYKFLHYTSLQVLFAILNSGKIRMYNLKGMDDPYEVKYATDHLNIEFKSDYEKNWKLDGYYGLSMIRPSLETESKSLDVWRKYGHDGRGVAIELTFNKRDIQEWQNFVLSKVYYGDSEFKFLQNWRNSYVSFHKQNNFTIKGFDDVMAQLRGFHKKMAYHTEKEVRLIHSLHGMGTYSEKQLNKRKEDHKFLHPDVTARGKPSDYFELQIHTRPRRLIFKYDFPV